MSPVSWALIEDVVVDVLAVDVKVPDSPGKLLYTGCTCANFRFV